MLKVLVSDAKEFSKLERLRRCPFISRTKIQLRSIYILYIQLTPLTLPLLPTHSAHFIRYVRFVCFPLANPLYHPILYYKVRLKLPIQSNNKAPRSSITGRSLRALILCCLYTPGGLIWSGFTCGEITWCFRFLPVKNFWYFSRVG